MSTLRAVVLAGKAEGLLPGFGEATVDSAVTDPPYGLAQLPAKVVLKALAEWVSGDRWFTPDGTGFMSKDWDKFVPPPGLWDQVYRVLKPGGYLLAFAAPRTADLMGLSIRLAGFEVHDSLHWIYGQGFPKAKSRLKPAHEPILMARKPGKANPPLSGLDGCAVGTGMRVNDAGSPGSLQLVSRGRWPPNLLLTHSADCVPAGTRAVKANGSLTGNEPSAPAKDVYGKYERTRPWQAYGNGDGTETLEAFACAPGCPVARLDAQSGVSTSQQSSRGKRHGVIYGGGKGPTGPDTVRGHADTGGASRFFPQFTWSPEHDLPFLYQAKAPKSERPQTEGISGHPTVKPLALIRWLARLVTPPGGLMLDPFGGTMTAVQAALLEGFRCAAMDSWPDAIEHGRTRLAGIEGVVFG